jgi:type IV secretory pathway VirB2 component (pilin)
MKSLSRTITGGVITAFSIWFIVYLGLVSAHGVDFSAILTGGFFLVIGIFIIFNEDEDKIEKIKEKN